jgi:hypothetical protein
MTGAGIALLSVFPAVALVGGASEAGHSISRSVVMVVGSDKTVCSGVVGPVFEESDGRLAVLGLMSWSTGPALTSGCGGLTGATPIVRYRDWVIKTAAAMGSVLNAMAPAEVSNKANSPKPAE